MERFFGINLDSEVIAPYHQQGAWLIPVARSQIWMEFGFA